MRSKTILSTAAFVLAFAASAAFASLFVTETRTESEFLPVRVHKPTSCFKDRSDSAAADKIAALIRKDDNNGRKRSGKIYDIGEDTRPPFTSSGFPDYAEAVEQYVDESSSLQTGDLPGDFQIEWREHMKAWRENSEFLNQMKKSSNRKSLSDVELEELEYTDDFHSREISRTWQAVLQTGRSYGANVY